MKSLPLTPVVREVRHAFQRRRVSFSCVGPSLAKQSFRDECDINNIMKKFEKDGVLTHYNEYQGQYGDFTDAPEYHDALNKVMMADTMFLSVPAYIRKRFDNDPAKFLEFVSNPDNVREMQSLGLMRDGYVAPDKGGAAPDDKSGTAVSDSKST
ncbi:MAG: internal scaffolding protein [Microvirus sp.]|nr:MAG: internal scaffolding protein [Microvirus sp.]